MRIPIPPIPLPEHVVEAAQEYADGRKSPVEPRDAATVILLRPSEHGPSVYYLRRQVSSGTVIWEKTRLFCFSGGLL